MRKSFIFIGPSGSGKGTQAKKLLSYLKEQGEAQEPCYIEAGKEFRTFIEEDGFVQNISKEVYGMGKRQPDFLAVYMWANILIRRFNGQESTVFDGTPRSLTEAKVLDTALRFLRMEKVYVITLSLSREVARERLTARGRHDDDPYGIEKRLDWFEEDVIPAIEYYKKHPSHTFIEVNGEEERDVVWGKIKAFL